MRLEVTVLAEVDFARVYDFNLTRSEAWADRVQDRLLERAKALLVTPEMGRPLGRSRTKRLSIPDIQYVIDYEVQNDAIRILQIRSTREII